MQTIQEYQWKVMPTSISRQSLLVLPDPGHKTPKISLQMDTEIARILASSANSMPELVKTINTVADWLERSNQINPDDMIARNLLLAKELRAVTMNQQKAVP
jgi:hypothetical protein